MKTKFINQIAVAIAKDGIARIDFREVEVDQQGSPDPAMGDLHGKFVMALETALMLAESIQTTHRQLQDIEKANMSIKN